MTLSRLVVLSVCMKLQKYGTKSATTDSCFACLAMIKALRWFLLGLGLDRRRMLTPNSYHLEGETIVNLSFMGRIFLTFPVCVRVQRRLLV